ncbi:hypothetical protein [Neorhodopirellula lusitana]|uniref:hypothetical protein n=1 Tax=Neorhodopirellula lusitana TaxID=445327 RepID=UPI00384D01AB
MTIHSLSCPKCNTTINAPIAMLTVRCPACANVFASAQGVPGAVACTTGPSSSGNPDQAKGSQSSPDIQVDDNALTNASMMIYLAVGGTFVFMTLFGIIGFLVMTPSNSELESRNPKPTTPVLHEATEEELASLTIVKIPEGRRRRIYDDMRITARMTSEKQLMVPGGGVRKNLEGMLKATYENSIQQLAALNNVSMDDVRNIVREGDLKNWDPRARSNARRDGERVYDEERSQGYKAKKPI